MELTESIKNTLKWSCFFVLAWALASVAYTQNATDIRTRTVTLGFTNEPLEHALLALERASGFQLTFPNEPVEAAAPITFPESERTVEATLRLLLRGTNLDFQVVGNNIVLSVTRETPAATAPSTQARTITGTIIDEFREPMPFVTVAIPGTTVGTVTDFDGRFSIAVPPGTMELQASFVGFRTQTVALTAATTISIVLESEALTLEQVVIVGSFEREAESFTGSFTTVTSDELRQVGSVNVVESLRALDPSFVVLENMTLGADPNAMPNIEVRGTTTIDISEVQDVFADNPNLPLFILDGFETTLQRIVDLDFNRVASVTLLKDAASTAFFGSRAANGVLVVETVRAAAGPLRVTYVGDFSLQIPDLSSYNMMNATEKLEFERLSGRFTAAHPSQQDALDQRYNFLLTEVTRGVNTHWMAQPLQIPFIQRHSFRVEGGTDELTYLVGLMVRNAPGVMKGSGRQAWGGDIDLSFRRGNVTVFNQLSVSGFTATESPYGRFSTWVNTNPYYRLTDDYGAIRPNLEDVDLQAIQGAGGGAARNFFVPNPLFNAGLNSVDQRRNLTVDERISVRWDFRSNMNVQSRFQISHEMTNGIRFIPPEHTDFHDAELDRRGHYTESLLRRTSWLANLMYTWNERVGQHNWALNVRGEMGHEGGSSVGWSATGYPVGTTGVPSFAGRYADGIPSYSSMINRRVNALASANYGFRGRYLADFTLRLDGSTAFGSARRFTPFWSAGLGWNIHEEAFMRQYRWVDMLRFRATVGQTGNQNRGNAVASTVFSYPPGSNPFFGPGLIIRQFGNPQMEWQKTLSKNLAMEFRLFSGRLLGRFEVYERVTDPLVIMATQAPSVGVSAIPMSLGTLTYRGFEFDLTYNVIRQRNFAWRIRTHGTTNKGVYNGFGRAMEGMDDWMAENNFLQRFRDGYGPSTQWAVRSLGIDPATGRELFLNRNGEKTFIWDANDVMAIGSSRPIVMGHISNFFTYRNLTLSVIMRVSVGAEIFNTALFDKVENISFSQIVNNQDRRALTERWNPETPGIPAQFRSIAMTEHTPMSSRFLQREHVLAAESIGLQWRLSPTDNPWMKKMRLSSLNVNATLTGTGGVFRLSNVKRERGIEFPEATTISLTINASF